MTLVLSVVVYVVCGLTALLALYYAARDLAADLVLLGACALSLLVWFTEGAALALRDLGGGAVGDPVTLYGYLLTGLVLPLGQAGRRCSSAPAGGAWWWPPRRSRWWC